MFSICAFVCGSSTWAKSLTYPVGCKCDTDSALAAMPSSNRHIARHILTRAVTRRLYKTFPARNRGRMQSSCLRLVFSSLQARCVGHLRNLQPGCASKMMGKNGTKSRENSTLGSNARGLARPCRDVERLRDDRGRGTRD